MAALPQCFSYHCCIESLGKLPPKGFGQHTVNVSAILRILLWIVCLAARAVGSSWATGAAAITQNERQRRQPVSVDSSQFFLSWRGLRRPVAFVAGPPPCVLTRLGGPTPEERE